MTTLIDSTGERLRIIAAHHRKDDEVLVVFINEHEAHAFLIRIAEDEFNLAALRRFALEVGLVADVRTISDERLLEYLAEKLVTGQLQTVRPGVRQRAGSEGGKSKSEPKKKDPPPPAPEPPPTDEKTWIRFEVVDDETGKPVPGVTLKLKLSDGQSRNAKTDGAGVIEIKGIPPGTCDVLGMVDSDALEVVSVG